MTTTELLARLSWDMDNLKSFPSGDVYYLHPQSQGAYTIVGYVQPEAES